MEKCRSDDEMRNIGMEESDMLEKCGVTTLLTKSTAEVAKKAIIEHFNFYRYLPAALQFMDGKLSLVCKKHQIWIKPLLGYQTPVECYINGVWKP